MAQLTVEGGLPCSIRHSAGNAITRLRTLRRCRSQCGARAQNWRHFHQCIYPNTTRTAFAQPINLGIECFTPDGRYLLAFSVNAASHEAQLEVLCRRNIASATCFEEAFVVKHQVLLQQPIHTVQRDLLLFPPDTPFVIIATREQLLGPVLLDDNRQSLKGLKIRMKVRFLVINYVTNDVVDQLVFDNDHIVLGAGLGVTFKGGHLAITSLRYQELRLYHLRQDGLLTHAVTIGQHCLPDDGMVLEQTRHPDRAARSQQAPSQPVGLASLSQHLRTASTSPFTESSMLTGFQQKMMTCLYQQALTSNTLRSFYFHFEDYLQLVLWQASLINHRLVVFKLGASNLLLKCRNEGNPWHSSTLNVPGMLCYFAFYDFTTGTMLAVLDNSNKQLLETYQASAELFQSRPPYRHGTGHRTASDSRWYNEHFEEMLIYLLTSRNGGYNQAIRRSLSMYLPTIAAPSAVCSPLLDRDLYSFDAKAVIKQRHTTTDLVKFQSRQRQRMTFSLDPNPSPIEGLDPSLRRRTTFCFHPFLPLVLTIQMVATRQGQRVHVNVHYHTS
eukprot:m.61379 g.61379  ORF g.61379 m.61379 type:complete len:556 (+) comp13873_c0_seq2:130-1797(+)